MITKVAYWGVVFGVYAMSSTNGGTTVVRPIGIIDRRLSGILRSTDLPKCIGKTQKIASDVASDEFGIKLAAHRCYRMLVGMAKVRLDQERKILDAMQIQNRSEQDRMQNARYPKEKKTILQRVKGALAPKQLPAKKNKKLGIIRG